MPSYHASDSIPSSFVCPISLSLMVDPVALPSGITYDRSSIEKWLQEGNSSCPVTMTAVGINAELIPNHTLKRLIQEWCVQEASRRSNGADRISADPQKVRLMLNSIACGINRLACLKQLRSLVKGGEINKRLIHDEGLISVLLDFMGTDVAGGDVERETIEALQEAICTLALFNMNDIEVHTDKIKLSTVAWLLNGGSMDARVNAALFIEKLAIDKSTAIKLICSANGVISGLFGLLGEDLYPAAVKASLNALVALYNGASEDEVKVLIKHKGGVKTLIELLPGAERGKAERILTLLRTISVCADGRAAISEHALAVPVLVRSLLVLSELANELAIGLLWAIFSLISPISNLNEALIEEAAQLGATQKLLMVAQMDCTIQTKQKIKDLLKALARVECLDSFHNSERL